MYSDILRFRCLASAVRVSSIRLSIKGIISPMCPIMICNVGKRSKILDMISRSACSPPSQCQPHDHADVYMQNNLHILHKELEKGPCKLCDCLNQDIEEALMELSKMSFVTINKLKAHTQFHSSCFRFGFSQFHSCCRLEKEGIVY